MIRKLFYRLVSWNGFLATLFICVLIYSTIFVPHFASAFNLSQAAAGVSEKAILLLPMALLIIAREIDLSVASILALTSVVLGVLIREQVTLAAAIPLVLATGTIAGALNGLLVTGLKLPSLVVTLGTMALFRGIGYIMLGTHSVNELPDALTNFGINSVGPTAIPWTIVPFVVLAPISTSAPIETPPTCGILSQRPSSSAMPKPSAPMTAPLWMMVRAPMRQP